MTLMVNLYFGLIKYNYKNNIKLRIIHFLGFFIFITNRFKKERFFHHIMSSEFYHKRLFEKKRVRGERVRPKSFKTEDSAKDYAMKNSIEKYMIEQKGKKFFVVQK